MSPALPRLPRRPWPAALLRHLARVQPVPPAQHAAALRGIYQRRIERFILWWKQHDYPLAIWPDAGIPALENRRKQPSWRRIALSLLKQDMARSLSFGFAQTDIDRLVPGREKPS